MRQSLAAKLLDDSLQRDFNNSMPGMGMGGSYQAQGPANTMGNRQSANSRAPQRMNQAPSLTEVPSEFFYEHNFDENGVIYYLGSAGKRRMWQNPHTAG